MGSGELFDLKPFKEKTDWDKQRKPYNKKTNQWKFYRAGEHLLFQVYNVGPAIRVCPAELVQLLARPDPIAHTSYKGSKKGYVTTYLVDGDVPEIWNVTTRNGKTPELRTANEALDSTVDKQFNIFSRVVSLTKDLRSTLIQSIRDDVQEFCNKKPSSEKNREKGRHFTLVKRIEPEPKFTLIKPGQFSVVKDGKGAFHSICLIDIGFDFSKGCASTTTPDGFYNPKGRCSYCYAYQNGPCFIDTLFDIDEAYLKERIQAKIEERGFQKKRTLYFRLGQTVESHIPHTLRKFPGFYDPLKVTLRTMAKLAKKRRVRGAMPTKTLEFDKELVKLFKAANVSVLASTGYEQLESGMVEHGCDVEQRLDTILRYGQAGVNANIYIATDVTRSMAHMQPEAKRAYDFWQEHKKHLGVQFLDIRITKKSDAKLIGGQLWDALKYDGDQVNALLTRGHWGQNSQNYLHALITHPDYLKVIGRNRGKIRLCSTHAREEERRCGKCFMDKS
ncbi:hypothetical protein KY333_04570 [Candidatus Woesearchaeota archaeon]|nr:hypothetical protein [Candidatus Woesearchaeota archaeon]MBW2994208.1 hypothetical protein [Candidatus Woesearchaeota archaeon]